MVGVGIPWLWNISDELCLHTDGLGFGFVPVRSAFDYGYFDDLEIDIDFTQIYPSQIMGNTPFDVLIGRMHCESNIAYNGNHEDVLNPVLEYSPNRTNASNNAEVKYSFCSTMPKCLLNAEIGDEDMYLNNNELVLDASVSACNTIIYNEQTPFYTYNDCLYNDSSNLSMIHPTVGAVSREEPYYVSANLLEYSNNPTYVDYWCDHYNANLCCYNFNPHRNARYKDNKDYDCNQIMGYNQISAAPTILSPGESISILFPQEEYNWTISLCNTLGGGIENLECRGKEKCVTIHPTTPAGIYILTALSESGGKYTTKIIVK